MVIKTAKKISVKTMILNDSNFSKSNTNLYLFHCFKYQSGGYYELLLTNNGGEILH